MRFDDRVTGNVRTYAPYARIVHVDIDPAEIGKNVAVEVPSSATPGGFCRRSRRWSTRCRRTGGSRTSTSWRSGGGIRRDLAARVRRLARRALSADYVVQRIGELTDHEGVYVGDVGQNQMWLARYAGFRHEHAPQLRRPRDDGLRRAGGDGRRWARIGGLAITGDGGFQMTLQELMTLVQDDIPVKIAIFDNKKLGMIRQWQEIIYAGNYHSAALLGPTT